MVKYVSEMLEFDLANRRAVRAVRVASWALYTVLTLQLARVSEPLL